MASTEPKTKIKSEQVKKMIMQRAKYEKERR